MRQIHFVLNANMFVGEKGSKLESSTEAVLTVPWNGHGKRMTV